MTSGAVANMIDTGLKTWTGAKEKQADRAERAKAIKYQQGVQEQARQEQARFNALKYQKMEMDVQTMQRDTQVRKMDSIYSNWMETKNPKLIEQAVNQNLPVGV